MLKYEGINGDGNVSILTLLMGVDNSENAGSTELRPTQG